MLDFLRRRTQSEHERTAALLSAYVDGELTAKEKQQVEAHLAHCEACTEALRTWRYTKALLVEAPTPRLPRSFVVRRADLEARPAAAPRRALGLRSGLAHAYLRGATAVVTVAFALLVAGDLIAQFGFDGFGARQPAMALVKEIHELEQEVAVEITKVVQKAIEEAGIEETPVAAVEKEVEKAGAPAATPSLAQREVSPTASPPVAEKVQKEVESLAVSEEAPTQPAADNLPPTKEQVYGADEAPTPTLVPTLVPPSPTLPPTTVPPPSPTVPPVTPERAGIGLRGEGESHRWPSPIRIAEIGLGGLALILLLVSLVVRRQQS